MIRVSTAGQETIILPALCALRLGYAVAAVFLRRQLLYINGVFIFVTPDLVPDL